MALRYVRRYPTLPPAPTRGPLPPMVSVVIPLDRTNLITNPSFETNTTSWTAVGGAIARSATYQYHGVYSLAIAPSAGTNSDGAFYGTVAMTSGTPYAYSLKFKATGDSIGKQYNLSIATTGGVDLHVTSFTATGRWQWIRGVYGETATNNRRLYIRKANHAAANTFYIDGVQVEAITDGVLDATTYIDGDQVGLLVGQQPPPYGWNGTPHASTSYRLLVTRAGGYVINLSLYNFLLTGLIGLGMAAPNNVAIPYTVLDGARFQRVTKPPRTISLIGRWQSDDIREQQIMASDMRAVLDRDYTPLQQPLVLQIEPMDDCEQVIGDVAQIRCIYAGGLEGNDGNVPVEDIAPAFTMYVPFLLGGDAGVALSPQVAVGNANGILKRSAGGVWSALSTGITGGLNSVNALARTANGSIFAGGNFTDAGGSGADYIASWDGAAWSTVGGATALNTIVYDIVTAPNGTTVYVGGAFSNAGANANADRIATWDGATWGALSTGIAGGDVRAVVFGGNGVFYAGGDFTTAGGVAVNNIAQWSGSAWSVMGTGTNQIVEAMARGPGASVYVGGAFTTAGGVTVNRIARWNGSAWSALGSGITGGDVLAIAVGPNGLVYAAGGFSTAGGVAVNRIAVWNGTSWSPLGSGLNNQVNTLAFDGNGNLWAGGMFTTAGGVATSDHLAMWNGSSWVLPDVLLPGSPIITRLLFAPDGTLYMGYTTTGTATAAAIVTATNESSGIVYPTITINGPTSGTGRVYSLANTTTGFACWFNLSLAVGEVATLRFDPQNPSFTTNFQGDITSTILPGSQTALMYLAPGANSISLFASPSTVTAQAAWQRRYNGWADLVN